MRTFFVTTACVLAGVAITGRADAADMPTKAPVAAPAYNYNWSGSYVGFNAGGALDPAHFRLSVGNEYFGAGNAPGVSRAADQRVHTPGFTGGLQAGYNWQISNTV